jgi:hypothetical protein
MTRDEARAAVLNAERIARKYRNALVELLAVVDAREILSEGQMAEATGLDRVTLRELLDASVLAEPPTPDDDPAALRARWGKSDEALRRVFADGRERTCGEVADALRLNKVATLARLRRSRVVYQPRTGVFALRPAGEAAR